MAQTPIRTPLERICKAETPARADVEDVLRREDERDCAELFAFADQVRRQYMGDGILLRGIVEFSNHCRNTCLYCGLHRNNHKLERYHLTAGQVLDSVSLIASQNIKTVVLQSGEDDDLDAGWLADLIAEVKSRHDLAVTLSVGEWPTEVYRMWRQAGADRYLLKIETSDPGLYAAHHPGMSFENRLRCLDDLEALGYQVGSGCLVGLRGQTAASLAGDIEFLAKRDFDMIGIGTFIPHPMTELGAQAVGNVRMTLKVLALTRIVTRDSHLPATTALGSIGPGDGRIPALQVGANVLMPSFTPLPYRRLYDIYPGKRCVTESPGSCAGCLESMVTGIGRFLDYSRGDSLKGRRCHALCELKSS
ncbi:MAG: [FeFe] hydrogenase H-cluster radical SAM maturase HydE [Sedimentisphaerales bacterium]|nr:[FeFe] hydrogenase H-cluster radical SAM maturase HydE [Sedimentisphaerales bacterium]